MSEGKRVLKIEEKTISEAQQIALDNEVVGVEIEATGTADVLTGWNERPNIGKGVVSPGDGGRPYALGWPYVFDKMILYIDFDTTAGPLKRARVVIFRDGGPIKC